MKPLAIVTAGPASEPVDEVRRITNFATGEIGGFLAEALVHHGFQVLLFRGYGATRGSAPQEAGLREFVTNRDLVRLLDELSSTRGGDVRAVFHAAALSDYTVADVRRTDGGALQARKIPGDLAGIQLQLEPAAKVLPQLRRWFPAAAITAWKYELDGTRDEAIAAARRQIDQGHSRTSVLNGRAYGPGFAVLDGASPPLHFPGKRELSDFLASQAAVAVSGD